LAILDRSLDLSLEGPYRGALSKNACAIYMKYCCCGPFFFLVCVLQEEAKGERHRRALLRKGLDADMIVGLERVQGQGVDK
jgi:hypothetical protein